MSVNRIEWSHPDLKWLSSLFVDHLSELGEFTEVQPEDVPQPYQQLLAHTGHMTDTVEAYHQCPVDVEVLKKHRTTSHYAREILLRRSTDQAVVQYGIVRMTSLFLSSEVKSEVESEAKPLGRILNEHNVLRTVKLMTLWKIKPAQALKAAIGNEEVTECYGRTALIYADGVPAIELLEIII